MRVLVISHNCFSNNQSMGKTLKSLFSNYKKEDLMQLYFYPTIPNIDCCSNYYRVSDNDIINKLKLREKKCGRIISQSEVSESNMLFESEPVQKAYNVGRGEKIFLKRMRDILWGLGLWKNTELKGWLKKGNPDIVFFAIGDAVFSQKIAIWVADYLNIPLVTYVCDDYYFYYKNNKSIYKQLLTYPLVKTIKNTIKKSRGIVTICHSLSEKYETEFDITQLTVMTGSSFKNRTINLKKESDEISYIGNLSLNRWKSLIDIQNSINIINKEKETYFKLRYYGNRNINLDGIIDYGGFLDSSDVVKVIQNSKMIIHVETFDEEYRDRIRFSVSTKIADSLASGRLLFAYGPDDIASIQYLSSNNCSVVCTQKKDLTDKLKEALFFSTSRLDCIQELAYKTAETNHNSTNNSLLMQEYLKKLID